MTEKEQIEEMRKEIENGFRKANCRQPYTNEPYPYFETQKTAIAKALYNEGYRKVPFGATVLAPEERNDEIREMHEILEGRDELIAKVGILGRENYDLKAEIKHLNTIVERLDELLVKGIDDYIMGIDGVEGAKDIWERSAVREFADKLKKVIHEKDYIQGYAEIGLIEEIDELLKEYE